jgi:hypothetical protein
MFLSFPRFQPLPQTGARVVNASANGAFRQTEQPGDLHLTQIPGSHKHQRVA